MLGQALPQLVLFDYVAYSNQDGLRQGLWWRPPDPPVGNVQRTKLVRGALVLGVPHHAYR